MFPFNCINDDLEFTNCLYILLHSDKLNVEFSKNTKQLNLINNFVVIDNFLKANCQPCSYYLDNEFNDFVLTHQLYSNLSVLHIKARSLNKSIDKVLQLLADIQFTFSVIAVTEIWANENNQCLLHNYT